MSGNSDALPLVYACSGCSNVGQLANRIAMELDRAGDAEMSCTTGVGGGVPTLVRKARAGRHIVAVDGCHLHCAAACLAQAGVKADKHVTLADHGLRKRYGEDCDDRMLPLIVDAIREHLATASPPRQACAAGK
jgi:uncharacterized metal-binding protein